MCWGRHVAHVQVLQAQASQGQVPHTLSAKGGPKSAQDVGWLLHVQLVVQPRFFTELSGEQVELV